LPNAYFFPHSSLNLHKDTTNVININPIIVPTINLVSSIVTPIIAFIGYLFWFDFNVSNKLYLLQLSWNGMGFTPSLYQYSQMQGDNFLSIGL
jgi:hypothetical protein